MKLLKLLVVLVVLVVLLLVIAGAAALSYVDSLARSGIEKGGTYALGVETTLKDADVGILSGTFDMSGLKVANASGFPGPHFLTLGDGSVAVDLSTLRAQTVELPHLKLDTIDVRLEKKDGKANYNVILENLKKVSGGSDGGSKPAPSGDEKKFIISDLTISNVTVHVDLLDGVGAAAAAASGGAIAKLTNITIPIKEVKLQNVGRTGSGVGGTGVTMGELSGIIVQALLAAAVENGGGLIPADMLGDLQGRLAALGDLSKLDLKTIANSEEVTKRVEEAKKQVEDAAKDIGKKLEGLLPGQKKDEKK